MTGMLAIAAAATIWPYSDTYCPENSATTTGAVLALLWVRITAKKNSFQASMNANAPVANSGGREMGSTTSLNTCIVDAPSTAAARSSSRGTASKKPLSTQITMGSTNDR